MTMQHQQETFSGLFVSDTEVDAGEAAFSRSPQLEEHLGWAVFMALAKSPGKEIVTDCHPTSRNFNAGTILAIAIGLAKQLRPALRGDRIGIVLPPGIGAFAANVAVVLAGRIPVNLNFTLGRAAAGAAIRKAGIETLVTAGAMKEKVPDFPWTETLIDVGKAISDLGKPRIAMWLLAVRALPARWLARRVGVPEHGGDKEAALLFTSGSAGDPKGVVLTHRNIVGNCLQTRRTGMLDPGHVMLGCLPVFHSFGFTVTMWYPMLHGLRVATFPSPLETRRLAEIVEAEKVTLVVGAPTFLRPFLKRAQPEQFAKVKTVISGAEKLPRDLYDAFLERFGIRIAEGYGLTETTPVLAVNRSGERPLASGGGKIGSCPGSVGLIVDGMRACIVDPETLEIRKREEPGLLLVRGCNVFKGYLEDAAATAAVFHHDWFVTGDLARFDDDGFLFIEGRLARFSKVGGEMVPHIAVEQAIIDAVGWEGAETQPVVVVGVPDEAKGEALVALTSESLTVEAVRERLTQAGMPNLWIPKWVIEVERIPTLSTGKLDLQGCQQKALEVMENPAG